RGIELVSEEERIRLSARAMRAGRIDQRRETLRGGRNFAVGVAHHALGHRFRIYARMGSQRTLHQQARDANAESAADELAKQEALARIQHVPVVAQARFYDLRALATQGR